MRPLRLRVLTTSPRATVYVGLAIVTGVGIGVGVASSLPAVREREAGDGVPHPARVTRVNINSATDLWSSGIVFDVMGHFFSVV